MAAHRVLCLYRRSFTLTDFSNWAIAIAEDQGVLSDSRAGVGSTTGEWTHVALTWRSSDGRTQLYLDGVLTWRTVRARDARIASGGTLVVGREQDCKGATTVLQQ